MKLRPFLLLVSMLWCFSISSQNNLEWILEPVPYEGRIERFGDSQLFSISNDCGAMIIDGSGNEIIPCDKRTKYYFSEENIIYITHKENLAHDLSNKNELKTFHNFYDLEGNGLNTKKYKKLWDKAEERRKEESDARILGKFQKIFSKRVASVEDQLKFIIDDNRISIENLDGEEIYKKNDFFTSNSTYVLDKRYLRIKSDKDTLCYDIEKDKHISRNLFNYTLLRPGYYTYKSARLKGIVNKKFEEILAPKYYSIKTFEDHFIAQEKKNGNSIFLDSLGNEIIEGDFRTFYHKNGHFYLGDSKKRMLEYDSQSGRMDSLDFLCIYKGRRNKYEYSDTVKNRIKKKYGFIRLSDKKQIVPCKYKNIDHDKFFYYAYDDQSTLDIYDADYQLLHSEQNARNACAWKDSLIFVSRRDTTTLVLNASGDLIKDVKGIYSVDENNLIVNGKFFNDYTYLNNFLGSNDQADYFYSAKRQRYTNKVKPAVVLRKDGKCGLLDYDGNWLTDFIFEDIKLIEYDHYKVSIDGKTGLLSVLAPSAGPPDKIIDSKSFRSTRKLSKTDAAFLRTDTILSRLIADTILQSSYSKNIDEFKLIENVFESKYVERCNSHIEILDLLKAYELLSDLEYAKYVEKTPDFTMLYELINFIQLDKLKSLLRDAYYRKVFVKNAKATFSLPNSSSEQYHKQFINAKLNIEEYLFKLYGLEKIDFKDDIKTKDVFLSNVRSYFASFVDKSIRVETNRDNLVVHLGERQSNDKITWYLGDFDCFSCGEFEDWDECKFREGTYWSFTQVELLNKMKAQYAKNVGRITVKVGNICDMISLSAYPFEYLKEYPEPDLFECAYFAYDIPQLVGFANLNRIPFFDISDYSYLDLLHIESFFEHEVPGDFLSSEEKSNFASKFNQILLEQGMDKETVKKLSAKAKSGIKYSYNDVLLEYKDLCFTFNYLSINGREKLGLDYLKAKNPKFHDNLISHLDVSFTGHGNTPESLLKQLNKSLVNSEYSIYSLGKNAFDFYYIILKDSVAKMMNNEFDLGISKI